MAVTLLNSRLVTLCLFALIILGRLLAVYDGRDPGYDQAMLMANFPLPSIAAYFEPLPYFEQATALGSIIELDIATRIFGNEGLARFTAIRAVAAALAIWGYFILWRIMRRRLDVPDALLALALMASTNEVLLFTTNPKNYVNEFFFACALLWAGIAYLDDPRAKRAAVFIGIAFLTCVFSFVAPLIFVAVGGGMLAETVSRNRRAGTSLADMRDQVVKLIGLGVVGMAISLIFHIWYTIPMTELDQAAYAGRYAHSFIDINPFFSDHNAVAFGGILNVFYLMIEPAYFPQVLYVAGIISLLPEIRFICLLIALVGLPSYWRRAPILAGGFMVGSLAFLALNGLHVLPIMSVRHFLFFTPFAVPSFAVGLIVVLRTVLTAVRLRALKPAIGYLLSLALVGLAAVRSTDLENAEVSAHLKLVDQYQAKLWVYYGAQPSLRALRPDIISRGDIEVIGLLDHRSTTRSWQLQARDEDNLTTSDDYIHRSAKWLSGNDPIWMLFAHFWPEESVPGKLTRFVDLAEADGRTCKRSDGKGGVLIFCSLPSEFPEGLRASLD